MRDEWKSCAEAAVAEVGRLNRMIHSHEVCCRRSEALLADRDEGLALAELQQAIIDDLFGQIKQAREILRHVVDGYSVDPSSVCPICASIPGFLASTEASE